MKLPNNTLETLFSTQDKVDTAFREALGIETVPQDHFDAAILVELGEMYDHLHYSWWKHYDDIPDYNAAFMEVVDILHFTASKLLAKNSLLIEHSHPASGYDFVAVFQDQLQKIEDSTSTVFRAPLSQIFKAAQDLVFSITKPDPIELLLSVFALGSSFGKPPSEMLQWYTAKNAINLFRIDHGYLIGEYIKTGWTDEGATEDNDYIITLIEASEEPLSFEDIYTLLEYNYPGAVHNPETESEIDEPISLADLDDEDPVDSSVLTDDGEVVEDHQDEPPTNLEELLQSLSEDQLEDEDDDYVSSLLDYDLEDPIEEEVYDIEDDLDSYEDWITEDTPEMLTISLYDEPSEASEEPVEDDTHSIRYHEVVIVGPNGTVIGHWDDVMSVKRDLDDRKLTLDTTAGEVTVYLADQSNVIIT
jgi:dimeric dUTPase (all-alpha-NTP-PPase superfamily)